MSVLGKLKCYISSAILLFVVYHVATECPLNEPLPFTNDLAQSDNICLYSHSAYAYVQPYSDIAIDYYNQSPIKPYVDDSIVIIIDKYNQYGVPIINKYVVPKINKYEPIAVSCFHQVYAFTVLKLTQLKERLDNDELSNAKKVIQEDILIPAEDNMEAFVGTPGKGNEKVQPVVPSDDAECVESSTIANKDQKPNSVIDTKDSQVSPAAEEIATDAEPVEEVEPIASNTASEVGPESTDESILEKIVEEIEDIVENVAAGEAIEIAEEIGHAL